MTKRFTICIDCSDENAPKVQEVVDYAYKLLANGNTAMANELPDDSLNATDPNFNWDVCIDELKVDEDAEPQDMNDPPYSVT